MKIKNENESIEKQGRREALKRMAKIALGMTGMTFLSNKTIAENTLHNNDRQSYNDYSKYSEYSKYSKSGVEGYFRYSDYTKYSEYSKYSDSSSTGNKDAIDKKYSDHSDYNSKCY